MLSNSKLLFFTISFFILGILYYWLVRESTIVSECLGIEHFRIEIIWFRIDWFPSFVHQFSFAIFTWLTLERTYIKFSLLFWFIVNILFELGQAFPSVYSDYFPKILANYFKHGTYSHDDILAIMVATVVAYFVMIEYQKKGV